MGQTATIEKAATAPANSKSSKVKTAKRPDDVPETSGGFAAVFGRRLEDVVEVKKGKPLGTGAFGTVWRAKFLEGGKALAVKTLDKQKMKQLKVPDNLVLSEVEFMGECKGQEWFVQLYDFLDTSSSFHLLVEYCDGGNLEEAAKTLEGGLSERRTADFMSQLLSGIAFLHGKQICHRDIKPQNAMLSGRVQSSKAKLRLGDFGIAVRFQPGKLLNEKLGTPAFMAPEMHMLPRSAGYDHKVDLWAAGTFMVFLLSLEYPFVDGKGRLLKNDLLRGDLPIWEGNAFQSLFRNVQEVTGLCKKRPSGVARDLVRHLLSPKRQSRFDAKQALQHKWFTAPEISGVEEVLDAPLLQWADFEEGLTGIQREFQRAAEDMMEAVEGIQIGSDLEQQILLDPKDDRLRNCVVCFQESGHFGFFCKQCYHSVCIHCLVKLPKPECPHCRNPAMDVAAAQHLVKMAEVFDTEAAMRAGSVAWEAALQVGSNVAENLGKVGVDAVVDIDMTHLRPLSEEQRKRGNACCVCCTPAGAMNHVCPACYASVCFSCAKNRAANESSSCPACGDVHRNAEPLKHYLAAGEAWDGLHGLATRAGEGVLSALSTGAEALTTRGGAFVTNLDLNSPSSGQQLVYDQEALRRSISVQAKLQVSHACHLCSAASSAFDMACGKCSVSVCSSCIGTRLGNDPCCPGCGDREVFNASAVRFQRNAQQISSSASQLFDGLWLLGQGLFSDGTSGANPPVETWASEPPAKPQMSSAPESRSATESQSDGQSPPLPRLVVDTEATTEVSL